VTLLRIDCVDVTTGLLSAMRSMCYSVNMTDELMSRTTLGPYRLLRLLGQGGMGFVHLAEHTRTRALVALKTLRRRDPIFVRGFRREVSALKRLCHPNIVQVVDDGTTDQGWPWYAMESLTGVPLDQVIQTESGEFAGRSELVGRPAGSSGVSGSACQDLEPKLAERWWTATLADAYGTSSKADAPRLPRSGVTARTVPHQSVGGPGATSCSPGSRTQRTRCFDEAVRTTLGYLAQVSHALAYLHGEGFVHCDLKPQNIIVTLEGRAVLVDFGIVALRGDTTLLGSVEEAGLAMGSAHYFAPERLQGLDFDARLDLYSLGCMLFEGLTGTPPFQRASRLETIQAQINEPVPNLEEIVDGIPPKLVELTQDLLSKRAADRPSNALQVYDRLCAAGIHCPSADYPPVKPPLHQASLIGRESMLDLVRESIQAADHGTVQFVLLRGESGVGKSRLAAEAVRYARLRELDVLVGQCSVVQSARLGTTTPSLGAFRRILKTIGQREGTPGEVGRRFGAFGRVLAGYVSSLQGRGGADFSKGDLTLDVKAARIQLFWSLQRVLEANADERGVLLVVEDLQWIDELSLGALSYLRQAMDRKRLMILGTFRSDEASAELVEFSKADGVQVVDVDRLSAPMTDQLLSAMLGTTNVPESLRYFIRRHSQGNPFFVVSCLWTAVEAGYLGLTERGAWFFDENTSLQDAPMPTTLAALVKRRLLLLSDRARNLVQAASVLGREMSLECLEFVADTEGFDIALDELVSREVLEFIHGSGEEASCRFVHDKLVEITYAQLDDQGHLRATFHQRAALFLTARRIKGADTDLGRLAWHLEEAGSLEEARAAYFEAFDMARERYAHEQAANYLAAASRLGGEDDEVSLAAKLMCAHVVLWRIGRPRQAKALLEEVLAKTSETMHPHKHAECLRALGLYFLRHHKLDDALLMFGRAQTLFRRLGDSRGERAAIADTGSVYLMQDRYDDALARYEEARRISCDDDDRGFDCCRLIDIASIRQEQGRYAVALAHFQDAVEMAREVGYRSAEVKASGRIGTIHQVQGRPEEALVHYQAALDLARDVGDRPQEGIWLGNMAAAYQEQGQYAEAIPRYEGALQIAREIGVKRLQGIFLTYLGRTHRQMGAFELARSCVDSAMVVLRRAGVNDMLGVCLCEVGHLRLVEDEAPDEAPDEELCEARAITVDRSLGPHQNLSKAVERLERAVAAQGRGDMLIFGQCLEDFPEAVRDELMGGGP
jgi:eukaryotic-like serine/threonine-protein kinase